MRIPGFRQPVGVAPAGLAVVGGALALAAVLAAPGAARAAAEQDWPAFVLVAGLLLVGLVAHEDGLFAAAGHALARVCGRGVVLYAAGCVLVVAVTTLLNLDTSVTFVTPVLLYAARSRGQDDAPLLYACLLLSNAGSLLLPGSNLTNLIVLGHGVVSGREFFDQMALAGVSAALVTAVVAGVAHRRAFGTRLTPPDRPEPPVVGVGLAAVVAVTVLMLALRSPALPVALVGVLAILVRWWRNGMAPSVAVASSGRPSWPASSAWRSRWALWAGSGRGPRRCWRTSTRWAPPWWRLWPACW